MAPGLLMANTIIIASPGDGVTLAEVRSRRQKGAKGDILLFPRNGAGDRADERSLPCPTAPPPRVATARARRACRARYTSATPPLPPRSAAGGAYFLWNTSAHPLPRWSTWQQTPRTDAPAIFTMYGFYRRWLSLARENVRQASQADDFTAVSGAAGTGPGRGARLRVAPGSASMGRRAAFPSLRLSASFTRLLPATRKPLSGPDVACGSCGESNRRKRRPYYRLRRKGF